MPARKKNRRKLTFRDREFLWYVRDDSDSTAKVLHVLSDDKRFVVKYELMQRPSFVVVVGREFPGLPTASGAWTRLRCPTWNDDHRIIDGKFVLRLIEWCFDAERLVHRMKEDAVAATPEEPSRRKRRAP